MTIDNRKLDYEGSPKFILSGATVYQSEDGFTFSKYLDSENSTKKSSLNEEEFRKLSSYLANQLEHNSQRFMWQADMLSDLFGDVGGRGKRLLDVGCGGGAFLLMAKSIGFQVEGIELEVNRAFYSRNKTGSVIYEIGVDDGEFLLCHKGYYDAVTLWDVIEHVDFPFRTVQAVGAILKSAGYLLIDTPAKDSFYHRFGEFSYKMTLGRFPTFLNIMYSDRPFGHKQIFSVLEMRRMLEEAGFEVLRIDRIHELSFPYRYYLRKLLKSDILARFLEPLAAAFFSLIKIKNKMVVVARKRS